MSRHRAILAIFALMIVSFAALTATYAKRAFAAAPLANPPRPVSLVSPVSPDVSPTPVCGLAWNTVLNNPSGGDLYSISAISANDVWAVGSHFNSGTGSAVAMHWDGQNWSLIATPTFTTSTELAGVAAVSANDVWAVGYTNQHALILHWDGTQWNIMPGAAALQSGILYAVTANRVNDVWAVGWLFTGPIQTLTMHWDGTNWNVVPSPNMGSSHNTLRGVSAHSSNDVWAVGFYGSPEQTLIEHWNGTQWSVVPSPNVIGSGNNELYGVATISANDAWAVGYYRESSTPLFQAITLHWDGAQWSAVSNPGMATPGALNGVTTLSTNDIWAVGEISGNLGPNMAMHWDGTAWNIVPSTSPSGGQYLTAISALSTGDLWAVGHPCEVVLRYYDPCSVANTLVGHATWQGPPSQPNALQQLPITLTLKLGTTETDYPAQITDPSGSFTVSLGSLPSGTYNWRAKGPKYLANAGSVTITAAQTANMEIGLMRVGDCNNDNNINVLDFNIEKLTFGRGQGEPSYDARADFDGNNRVNVVDFNLQKVNFGLGGAPPIGPGNP